MRDVNMTPLIDVSLVIVTMLMLTTPLSFESSIGVRQACARSTEDLPEKITERLELNVVSEECVEINGAPVARASLMEHLRPALNYCGTKEVIIRCHDNVSHGTFVSVLDQAKICGAVQIGVLGK